MGRKQYIGLDEEHHLAIQLEIDEQQSTFVYTCTNVENDEETVFKGQYKKAEGTYVFSVPEKATTFELVVKDDHLLLKEKSCLPPSFPAKTFPALVEHPFEDNVLDDVFVD